MIQVRYKLVKALLKINVIILNFVKSEKNLIENLTKALPNKGVEGSLRGMDLDS